ncbi:MAG: SprT family zinc-dependent metalloprotease [Campylobacterota bacterium]|nr:SprT family zinc-dependent metalloprotease [Campylobacterota bacterium]
MSAQIILDNHTFTLIHRTNKKIKRVSLALENKNEIIVKTPLKFKSHKIKEIVFEYKEWILRSMIKVPAKNQFDFITGGKIPFLGIEYPMILKETNSIKNVKFSFDNENFIVEYNSSKQTYDDFIDGMKLFYKRNAAKVIDDIFVELSEKTQLFPNKVTYRFTKTRWGSCSFENNISINYKLLQFDKRCIEYVVLHELCHIVHKNHSKKFWDLVSFYMGDYKTIEKQLKSKLF